MTTQFQIYETVSKGERPKIPAGTPKSFAALIERCWAQRAEERPPMEEVKAIIAQMIAEASLTDGARTSGLASNVAK